MTRAAHIHTSEDARRFAKARLPWMVFDYIDGAAGKEKGVSRNRKALEDICLNTKILRNVSVRSQSKNLFGKKTRVPFGIAPMGMCNLSWPGADIMLARLAAANNVPHCVSTVASTSLETLIKEAEGNAWFQLYFSGDGTQSFKLANRAQKAGYEVLILTVDVPEVGRRPRELRHDFKMPFKIGPRQFIDFALHPYWSLSTLVAGRPQMANFEMDGYEFDRTESRASADWDILQKLRDIWKGKLVIKGVLDVDDALKLKEYGVDAIQISSHGARQIESACPPITRIAPMRDALGPDYPIFYDSGIQSGEDMLKALALGADFVFPGRIFQFAIAAAGREGLHALWDCLSSELDIAMAQTGITSLSDDQLSNVIAKF